MGGHRGFGTRLWLGAAAIFLLCASGPVHCKAIFKCTGADGKVTFRDSPCDGQGTQEQQQQQMTGHGATQASPASARAQPAPAKTATSAPAPSPDGCTHLVVPMSRGANPPKTEGSDQGPPGPVTVATGCSALLDACYGSGDDPKKTYDACFKAAPRCKTARPWEEAQACCPEGCYAAYTELRKQCLEPHAAAEQALFREQCVPGASRELQGH